MKPRPAGGLWRAHGRKRSKGVCEDRSDDCICIYRYGLNFFCNNLHNRLVRSDVRSFGLVIFVSLVSMR